MPKVGLLWFGRLTVADYGAWGGYVLSAPNLQVALERAAAIISLHTTHDRALFRVTREGADFVYRFGLKCGEDYENVVYSAIAVLASIPHFYLGPRWRPQTVHIDFPKPALSNQVEEVFGCPVLFGAPELVVGFRSTDLSAGHGRGIQRVYSLQDVKRERIGGPPRSFVEQVGTVIRMHMKDDRATAEMTAMTLGISLRGLQSRLNQKGLTHRQLLKEIRVDRAKELLALREPSITEIASQLGYTVPNNFTRSFSAMTGMSPREYRRSLERHSNGVSAQAVSQASSR